jgi:hypothetical protein
MIYVIVLLRCLQYHVYFIEVDLVILITCNSIVHSVSFIWKEEPWFSQMAELYVLMNLIK